MFFNQSYLINLCSILLDLFNETILYELQEELQNNFLCFLRYNLIEYFL